MTSIEIDDELLEKAFRLGEHRTKKATVNAALQEYIQRREQLGILELVGKIDYYDDYEPKKYRKSPSEEI